MAMDFGKGERMRGGGEWMDVDAVTVGEVLLLPLGQFGIMVVRAPSITN